MNRKRAIMSVSAIAAVSAFVGTMVPTMAADNNTSVVHVGDTATLSVDVSGDATEGNLTVTRSIDGGEPVVIRTIPAPVVSQTVSDTLPEYVTASAGTHIINYTITDAMGVTKTTQTVLDVQVPLTLQLTSTVMSDPMDSKQVYVDNNNQMFIKLNATGFGYGDTFTVERSIDYGNYQSIASNVSFGAGEYTDSISNASAYAGAQHSVRYRIIETRTGNVATSENILDLSKNTTLKIVDFLLNGSKTVEIEEGQSAAVNFSVQTMTNANPITLYKGVDGVAATYFKTIPMDGTVQNVTDTISGLTVGTHTVVYGIEDGKNIEFTVIVKAANKTIPTSYASLTTYENTEQDVSLSATATGSGSVSDKVRVYRSIDHGEEIFVSNMTADGKTQTLTDRLPALSIGTHKVLYSYKTYEGATVGYLDVTVTTEKAKNSATSVSGGVDKQSYSMTTGQELKITGWAQAPASSGTTTVKRQIDNGTASTVWTNGSDGAKHTYTDVISGLSVGTHTVTYTTYDSGTNTTATSTVTVNVTAAGSTVTSNDQTVNGVENSTTPLTLSGKYLSNGNTVYVARSIDGGASTNVTSFAADGATHSFNDTIPTLTVGTHRIVYTFTCNNAVVGTSTVTLNIASASTGNEILNISSQTPVVNGSKVATVVSVSDSRAWQTLTIKRYVDGAYHGTVKSVTSSGTYEYVTDEYTLTAGTHTVYYSVTSSLGSTAFSTADKVTINGSSEPKSSYYYSSKPTIAFPAPIISNYNVSGNVVVNDADTGDRLTVQRYVDGVLSKTFDAVSPNRTATPIADSFTLASGTHTVYYTVTDLYGNNIRSEGYRITAPSGTVVPVSGQSYTNAPVLTVDDASKAYQSGTSPEVVLKLYTPRYGERVDLYYQIDNEYPVRFDTVIPRNNISYITAKLPSNLKEGNHNVVFYAIDAVGNVSNYAGNVITDYWGHVRTPVNAIGFKIGNTTPTIVIDSLVSDTSTIGEPIDIDFTVTGKDGEYLDVYYYFDGQTSTSIGSYKSGVSDSVSIPTTGIEKGKHQLNIYAQNSDGTKSTVKSYNIDYSGNGSNKTAGDKKSVISGDEINNVPVVAASIDKSSITVGEQAVVSVNVVDKDEGEKITLYYSVDDGEDTLLTTFKSSGSATVKSITLPKLAVGSHKVKIWAKDAKGDVSDADYVNITVNAATTTATVFANNTPETVTPAPGQVGTITVTNGRGTIKTGVEEKKDNTKTIVAAVVGIAAVVGGGAAVAVKMKKNKK